MTGTCGTYGGEGEVEGGRELHTWFWWGYVMESDHLEDVGVHDNIILKWIVKK